MKKRTLFLLVAGISMITFIWILVDFAFERLMGMQGSGFALGLAISPWEYAALLILLMLFIFLLVLLKRKMTRR